MYINPKTIKELEALCFIKHQHNFMYNHNYQQPEKKYDLFNLKNENNLKECLGIKFLEMPTAIFKAHKKESIHFAKHYGESTTKFDAEFMPTRMNHYRSMMGLKCDNNDFESEMIMLENTIFMMAHKYDQVAFIKESLDYASLINEWKSFASHHNINLDFEFKKIIESIGQENLNNKEWLVIKEEFKHLYDTTIKFISEANYLIRGFYENAYYRNQNKNPIHIIEKSKIMIEESGLLIKLNNIKNKIKEFEVSRSQQLKDFKKENDHIITHINKNNKLLLDAVQNSYIVMKNIIDNQLKDFGYRNMAIDFMNEMNRVGYSEQKTEDYLEKNKNNTMLIVENFTFESIKYNKIAIFKDESYAFVIEGKEKVEYCVNIQSMNKMVETAMIVYLKHLLRKNPTIAKIITAQFNQRVEKENKKNNVQHYYPRLHYDKLMLCITTYFKNENILKSEKFNFIDTIENSKAYEKLDDKMNKIIREHKIRKYAESIVSNKYKHLYNDESYKLFKELYNLKIDTKTIQEMLGKKLATVESETMFNENIRHLINSFNNFNMNAVKLKAESVNAHVISDNDNILILEIRNYEQSKKLGSGSWCITRNKTYFDQYTEQGAKQYFIYDFNQSSKNTKSLIGITLLKTLKVKAAHTKSDARLNDNKIVEYLISKVKEVQEAKKSKRTLTVVDSKKSKQSSNTKITNVNDINPNGMIIGF